MQVLPLHTDDLEWIVDELVELPLQSSYYSDVPTTWQHQEYVLEYFENMYRAGMLGGVVSHETGAFLLFAASKPWYADRIEVHEIILWVPKKHRGSRVALKLIPAFIEESKKFNPHSIHAGATLDIVDSDKVLKLYERYGFKRDKHGVIMRL